VPRHAPEVRAAILDFVERARQERGYAPSVREIAAAVGLRSPASVAHHLRRLEEEGRLERAPRAARSLTPTRSAPAASVPLLADVGAGYHVVPDVGDVELLAVPASLAPVGSFALRVRGTSMVDAGILDGDVVIVRPTTDVTDGDVVVASIGDDAGTVKRLRCRRDGAWLEPANADDPSLHPMPVTEEVHIHGKVVGLLRAFDDAGMRTTVR
jgi:repressor LexA